MTNFESYLLGLYNNRSQAQSHPTEFPQVYILWEKIVGGYHSKQWYRRDGPTKPYREKYHKLVEVSETEVIMENYYLDWTRHEDCDMIFRFDGHGWHGQLAGDKCRGYRGDRVISEIHVYKDKLHTCDQGRDLETEELMWGSTELYRFTRKPE